MKNPYPQAPHVEIDSAMKRATRIIRWQGFVNVLLVIALIGSWIWLYSIDRSLTITTFADGFDPPVRVVMPIQILSDEKNVRNQDIVHQPIITLYGKVQEYRLLKNALPNFSVLVRKSTVHPHPETGEFAEKIVLEPGKNLIDVVVRWDGEQQYRYQYTITYIEKPVTIQESQTPFTL